MANQREIFTPKCQAILYEPHLVINKVLDGHTLDANDILELKQANISLTEGKLYAILVLFGAMTEVTQDARELIASKEFQQNTIAKALLVNNIGHRLLGNFYLSVNRPHIKTRLFTEQETALSWLRSELQKNLDQGQSSKEHNQVNF
jgi:hypothetical protein